MTRIRCNTWVYYADKFFLGFSMRLDKYLSQATGFSRKEVKRMLHADEVQINGEFERNPARKIAENDEVLLDGYPVDAPRSRYLMLNKPLGYVCSNDDGSHPSVLGLIELPRADEMTIAGRLDVDTTGLVLISSDGQWCHRITSPRHKLGKIYEASLAEPIDESYIERFERGILLNGEKELTKPAKLEILSENSARVELYEGRYHQVKRMFAALGNRVETLHRESIGPIKLDEELYEGEWRELDEVEVASIFNG